MEAGGAAEAGNFGLCGERMEVEVGHCRAGQQWRLDFENTSLTEEYSDLGQNLRSDLDILQ